MTQLPTRAAIDRAPPLDFPERQHQQVDIQIECVCEGYTVRVEYNGAVATVKSAIARLRAAGLEPSRTTAPTAAPAPRQRAETVEPLYQPDGTACCPVHRRALSEGRYGLFCSSKAQPGQAANDKGYCSLRFGA